MLKRVTGLEGDLNPIRELESVRIIFVGFGSARENAAKVSCRRGGGGSVWNRLIGEVTERSNRVSDPARWEEKRGHSGSRARFGMGGRYFVKVGLWFFSRAFAPRRRGGRFFFSFLA